MGQFKWSQASLRNRAELHPDLARLADFALEHFGADITIADGARTVAEQQKNVAKGVSRTMDSMHLPRDANGTRTDGPEGKAWAMDILPYPIDWDAIERGLSALKHADPHLKTAQMYMFLGYLAGVADALGIHVRLGADWDNDRDFGDHSFIDLGHVEIKKP